MEKEKYDKFLNEFVKDKLLKDYLWTEGRSKERIFLDRKRALIDRDPLTKEFLKELSKYNPQIRKPSHLKNLQNQLEKRWNVSIGITKEFNYISTLLGDKRLSQGKDFSIHHITHRKEPVMHIPPYQYGDIFLNGRLAVLIDLDLIDLNDARNIKRSVWEITKKYLKEKKHREIKEPSQIVFLYHCKEKTFNNYLRWYDIHTKEKLSFRLIAHIEKTKKKNPRKAEEILETLKSKKIRWGIPVKGEDAIEKGIKVIYRAIHREKYSQKKNEPVIEQYKCPNHGSGCSTSCIYYEKWINRFNRLIPEEIF